MHRKTSHRTTILLFLFLLVWVPVCLWTGILFAVRELRSEPAKAIAEVPTPEPKPAKTFEPYALSAAYTAFETGLSLRDRIISLPADVPLANSGFGAQRRCRRRAVKNDPRAGLWVFRHSRYDRP